MNPAVAFRREISIRVDEFVGVLHASGLAERRPVDELDRLAVLLRESNLIITARVGRELVGVARSVTDYAYCCYLSDLAVDREWQGQGIGRRLMDETQRLIHPKASLILLSAPDAAGYYPKTGFESHPAAFVRRWH